MKKLRDILMKRRRKDVRHEDDPAAQHIDAALKDYEARIKAIQAEASVFDRRPSQGESQGA